MVNRALFATKSFYSRFQFKITHTSHVLLADIYRLSSSWRGLFHVRDPVYPDNLPKVALSGIHCSRRIEIHTAVVGADICHHQMVEEILTESGIVVAILLMNLSLKRSLTKSLSF
jgi:hypothetical protein